MAPARRRPYRAESALTFALKHAPPDVIAVLLEKGADPNLPQSDGVPALSLAIVARDRQIAAAATLCALGGDPDLPDATGASARQVAARIAAEKGREPNPIDGDLLRHRNMAAFLARGAGCDALLARVRRGERIAEVEVLRIANESECDAGWGWACGQAGWAYHRGKGAAKNGPKALELFRMGCGTARTKNAWSCGMAGIIHVEGLAVPKDPAEGVRWLAKGCETPDPERADAQACHRLGLLHAAGNGVPKDPARARALFTRACDQKYGTACATLARQAESR